MNGFRAHNRQLETVAVVPNQGGETEQRELTWVCADTFLYPMRENRLTAHLYASPCDRRMYVYTSEQK